jgi:hypothetical protein
MDLWVFHALGMIPPEDHGLFVVVASSAIGYGQWLTTFSTTKITKLTKDAQSD